LKFLPQRQVQPLPLDGALVPECFLGFHPFLILLFLSSQQIWLKRNLLDLTDFSRIGNYTDLNTSTL
jgi:hypothetical protein